MITKFNKMILMIATILLILGLIIIGIIIIRSLEEEEFPPIVSDCPDYWNVSYNNASEIICNNNNINSGYSKPKCRNYPIAAFSVNGTSEADKICEKYKWAKECNIHWDGITNNPKACINTTM